MFTSWEVKIPLHLLSVSEIKAKWTFDVTASRERPNYSIPLIFFLQIKQKKNNKQKLKTHIQSQIEFLRESRLASCCWIVKIFESIDSRARFCCFANKWSIKSSIVCSVVSEARHALLLFPKPFVGRKTRSCWVEGGEVTREEKNY